MTQYLKLRLGVAALLATSLMTFTAVVVSNGQSARAALAENIHGGLLNLGDQIVKGGNHVVNEIVKGGKGFLKSAAAFVGIRNVILRINDANQDLAKGNTTGAALELKQANKALLNDSSFTYGLGQRISQITQNKSAQIDPLSRAQLSAIATDLKAISLNSVGVKPNSTLINGTTSSSK